MNLQNLSRRINQLPGKLLLAVEGQGLVEYAVIILVVALVVFAALDLFGQTLLTYYYKAVNAFP